LTLCSPLFFFFSLAWCFKFGLFIFILQILQLAPQKKVIVGGKKKIEDADNDEGFQRALQFAVVQHNNRTNDTVRYQVLKVDSAEHQVVEGSLYTMTVILRRTNCEKEAPADGCAVQNVPGFARPRRCIFEVWSRPWLNDTQLTKEECDSVERTSE
uniref:Cystatin domain-containing protein n=1 Tax=Poecilia formosa TaxID=48698 RepID=A0A096LUK3_POEFO